MDGQSLHNVDSIDKMLFGMNDLLGYIKKMEYNWVYK
jgi:hypothetical protein